MRSFWHVLVFLYWCFSMRYFIWLENRQLDNLMVVVSCSSFWRFISKSFRLNYSFALCGRLRHRTVGNRIVKIWILRWPLNYDSGLPTVGFRAQFGTSTSWYGIPILVTSTPVDVRSLRNILQRHWRRLPTPLLSASLNQPLTILFWSAWSWRESLLSLFWLFLPLLRCTRYTVSCCLSD